MRPIIVATMLLALAGCGTANAPKPIDLGNIDQVVNAARGFCRQGQPIVSAASMVPVPQVQIIAAAVTALCTPLLAGQIPTTLDANTPNWLATNLRDLQNLLAGRR